MCVQIVLGDSLPRTSEDDTPSLTQRGWSVLVQHCITLVAWPATSETRLVLLCCNTSQHTNKSTSCALVMRKSQPAHWSVVLSVRCAKKREENMLLDETRRRVDGCGHALELMKKITGI